MDYKLVIKLRDAGFKQEYLHLRQKNVEFCEKNGCAPTLSELIDACGNKFLSLATLWREDDGKKIIKWCASSFTGLFEEGETPEEAVANLWLKLNEQKK